MRLKALLVLALAPGLVIPALGGAAPERPAPRLVAVGDIHGAYEAFVQIMQSGGLIDANLDWIGGDAILVQTGDFTDRGAGVRPVMDLLMRMQMQAPRADGEVIVLLGNHEIMNLVGEVRDATPEIMGAFAGDDPAGDLREAFEEHEDIVLSRTAAWNSASPAEHRKIREEWVATHAAGYADYLRALGPDGLYGTWLRTLPAAAVVEGILFMHAGISPELADWGVERVNARIHDEIDAFDAYRAHLRQRNEITSFAHLREIIGGVARVTRGLDWFTPAPEDVRTPPELPPARLERVRSEERRFEPLLRVTGWHLLAAEGPMWFRGLAWWSDEELAAELPALLEALGVRAMVVAHTPQAQGIRVRGNGRLFLIDTGMLAATYGGSASALVFEQGVATAIHQDGSRSRLADLPVAATTTGRQ